jgi:tRNA-intron endonuclease
MIENKTSQNIMEIKTNGVLSKEGVNISEQSSIDALSQRGYGTVEGETFTLTFYEALYLSEKGMLEVKDEKGENVSFQDLLKVYEKVDENAWINYLVYRDLRSRGYVVREGFGAGIDFRIYERGGYGKDTASYLILSTQEGKPMPIEDMRSALERSQKQKKELILAVMNRRGEIVYYSVSQLTFK